MTVVIDTNVMNGMFVTKHPHAAIRLAWYAGRFKWALSTDNARNARMGRWYLRSLEEAAEPLRFVAWEFR